MFIKRFLIFMAVGLAVLAATAPPALATPVGYTDYAAFSAALPTAASVLTFEDMSYGETISSGGTAGGITFTYDFGNVSIMVTDDDGGTYPTTSATNYLGTVDGDVFQDGDDFDLSFALSSAIGMYFITEDEMVDGDIMLTVGGVTVSLDAASGIDIGEDRYAYFLGIVDADLSGAFTGASITTIGGGYFTYNVDDITTAPLAGAPVPEPATLWLLCLGLPGVFGLIRSRQPRRKRNNTRTKKEAPQMLHHVRNGLRATLVGFSMITLLALFPPALPEARARVSLTDLQDDVTELQEAVETLKARKSENYGAGLVSIVNPFMDCSQEDDDPMDCEERMVVTLALPSLTYFQLEIDCEGEETVTLFFYNDGEGLRQVEMEEGEMEEGGETHTFVLTPSDPIFNTEEARCDGEYDLDFKLEARMLTDSLIQLVTDPGEVRRVWNESVAIIVNAEVVEHSETTAKVEVTVQNRGYLPATYYVCSPMDSWSTPVESFPAQTVYLVYWKKKHLVFDVKTDEDVFTGKNEFTIQLKSHAGLVYDELTIVFYR